MFWILGLKTRQSTVGRGRYHCPNEGATRPYRQVRARRWFTVFFLPLVPLDRQGEWVRCEGCGATYSTDVLERHPADA